MHAVKGVTLDVRPGEVVAVVGESGSGKSVTAMTAMRLLPKNARINGHVVVNGHDVGSASPTARCGDCAATTSPWCSRSR